MRLAHEGSADTRTRAKIMDLSIFCPLHEPWHRILTELQGKNEFGLKIFGSSPSLFSDMWR